ncbi:BTAD domain-containing putative transcriptional regulator [Actinoplanes sp. NPDC049265]|uniref:BTAD domain-containing putative transcriptional regulator n=1 Tax=Actinoplanes sp. NPDC049265 TaxID=3363902 RepID=UPI003712433E
MVERPSRHAITPVCNLRGSTVVSLPTTVLTPSIGVDESCSRHSRKSPPIVKSPAHDPLWRPSLHFQVFDGVDVYRDGARLDVGPRRQRCVLAVLLAEAGRPVSVAQLIDRVWGDDAPQRARGALHNYISGLRRSLAPDAGIDRRPDGYCLTVDPGQVDMHRFRRLLAAGKRDDALALWRGRPFGSLDTPWLNGVRASLQRERHAAELDRNDEALAAGRHADLVHELATATETDQFDERLAGQFMLALSRSGRPADALQHYATVRRRLAEELGLDPSPALRAVHLEILSSGARPPAAPSATSPTPATPTSPAPAATAITDATPRSPNPAATPTPPAPVAAPASPTPAGPAPALPHPALPPPALPPGLVRTGSVRPGVRRLWLAVAAVAALALAAFAGATVLRPERPAVGTAPSPAAPSLPARLTPLTGDIRDGTVVAIVSRRSATTVAESYVVDIENWSTDPGGRAHLWHWRDDGDFRNQLWRIRNRPDGSHHIVNLLSGECLSGADGAVDVVQQKCAATAPDQLWTFDATGRVADNGGTRCLDIREGLLLEDTSLQVTPCGTAWSQNWMLTPRP